MHLSGQSVTAVLVMWQHCRLHVDITTPHYSPMLALIFMLPNPDVLMEGHAAIATHNLGPCLHLKYLLCTHIETATTVSLL
jgi:hypothetical protein